jgi:hypothetical protein
MAATLENKAHVIAETGLLTPEQLHGDLQIGNSQTYNGIMINPAVLDHEKSFASSFSQSDPEPGFAHIDGDIGGPGYNETKVDVVTVPCPGASPVTTWMRDPLPEGFFAEPAPAEVYKSNEQVHKLDQLWVRRGIRSKVSTARVLLYRHRELADGLTLGNLADDLIDHLVQMRADRKPRPFFFICHSVGGLVAKLALVKASKRADLRWIIYCCYGITFFGRQVSNRLGSIVTDKFRHSSSWIQLHVPSTSTAVHPAASLPVKAHAEVHHRQPSAQSQASA